MTREQLNDYIDTNITNKTIPNTLTPTNEGNALKEVADYVDQEILTISQVAKTVKRSLTHSELLDIFTTPIIVLPAVTGKMYIPKDILVKYINNDGWSSAGNWIVLLGTLQLTNFVSQMGGGTVKEQYTYLLQGNPSNTNDSFFDKNVFITSTANPTVPVNPLATADVYITYFEITL